MERRKFVIGLGSLVAGGAAATGTGAFTTASVERNADIRVSNDDTDAKLGFSDKVGYAGADPSNGRSPYADVNGGILELNFDGVDNNNQQNNNKSGMNPNGATYTFDNVFKIINNSSSTVVVGIDDSNIESLAAIDSAEIEVHSDDTDLTSTLDHSNSPPTISSGTGTDAELGPGESLKVDFEFVTANKSGYSTPFDQTVSVDIGGVDINA